jgi:protein-disulfide isomerase
MPDTKSPSKPNKTNTIQKLEAERVAIHANSVTINGGVMKDKLVPFLVALVVIGAFAVGLLYGKVSVYEDGAVAGTKADNAAAVPAAGDAVAPPPEITTLTDEQWQEIVADPVAVKGEQNAAVTMVEFTDYQCPFCARYFIDTYGQIESNYIDTGKVQYLVRDLPLSFHANAKPAAIAARCAGDQDAYFEMHDKLYETQAEWSNTADPTEQFSGYAADLGLNQSTFGTCYSSGEYDAAVDEELALAAKVGASGTPTFFINGEKLVGAQPYTAFEAAIEAALE